ncbi:MAG: hypothetical protein JXA92_14000 [candidate division Zixibacteria bacterium]|nr:hypothetical protein [candidate division Zixibacteria bacterium]
MQARIIDISENWIDLEVREQLRFKTEYVTESPRECLVKNILVDFSFVKQGDKVLVQINSIRR